MLNKILIFSGLFLIVTLPTGLQSQSETDNKANLVVERLWQAIGGQKAWQKTRYISFRWQVKVDGSIRSDIRHDWDRLENRYRVEGTDRGGKHYVALFNTLTQQGEVYLDGEKMSADSTTEKYIDLAYSRYINDTYWLLMPFKLTDPGVNLDYEGKKEINGLQCDIIKMTFDQVGLTPGDTYWVYVDEKENLVRRWEYHLQGWDSDRKRSGSDWSGWTNLGELTLSLDKLWSTDGGIFCTEVLVSNDNAPPNLNNSGKTL